MGRGQKLRLAITGIQYPPGAENGNHETDPGTLEPAVTVQEVDAEYFCRGGSHYLFYEEHLEGYPELMRTRVKQKGQRLEVHRQGTVGYSMSFEAGKTYRTEYATPYGVVLLDIITKSVEVQSMGEHMEGWPDVRIKYSLENEGQTLGEYELVIDKKSTD